MTGPYGCRPDPVPVSCDSSPHAAAPKAPTPRPVVEDSGRRSRTAHLPKPPGPWTPPPPPPTPKKPPAPPNGPRPVLARDTTAPPVTVPVYYHIGFRVEPRDRTGFAHLFEHLMFQ